MHLVQEAINNLKYKNFLYLKKKNFEKRGIHYEHCT